MEEENKQPTEENMEKVTLWQRIKPWVYMLIMFLSIMLSAKLFVGSVKLKGL